MAKYDCIKFECFYDSRRTVRSTRCISTKDISINTKNLDKRTKRIKPLFIPHPKTYIHISIKQKTYLLGFGCYKFKSWLCHHETAEVRKRIFPTVIRYGKQCLSCGCHLGRARQGWATDNCKNWDWDLDVRKSDERWQDFAKILGYYVPVHQRKSETDDIIAEMMDGHDKQYYYHKYLQSPEWKEKSRLTLFSCGYICEVCGIDMATQAHHKTYDNIFNEKIEDLQGVCNTCHAKIHHDIDELYRQEGEWEE
jgi:hypothetical protein